MPFASLAVTVKLPAVPAVTGEGNPVTDRVVAAPATTRVAVVVLVLLHPPDPLACTVSVEVPAGVAPVVLIVKVEVLLPEFETEVGLNEGFAPEGSPAVTPRVAVQAAPLPEKLTVTGNVPELPAAIGLGFCAPTETLWIEIASVNVFCACACEPTAVK